MRFRTTVCRRSPYGKVLGVAVLVSAVLALTPTSSAQAGPAGAKCSTDPNAHVATVPSPEQFFGFPLGQGQPRVLTTEEINNYLKAVGSASNRVVTGTMAHSVSGQELPYAIVSDQHHMVPGQLKKIAAQVGSLRDPRSLKADKAARIAEDSPPSSGSRATCTAVRRAARMPRSGPCTNWRAACPAMSPSATTTSSRSSCRPRTRTAATRAAGRTSTAST